MKIKFIISAFPFLILLFMCSPAVAQSHEKMTIQNILNRYRLAIEKIDTTDVLLLFQKDAKVYEQGSNEGDIAHYLTNHLVPELKMFKSIRFTGVTQDVLVNGIYAFVTEVYLYTIELKEGKTVKSSGVNTVLLRHTVTGWKITHMHTSFRKIKS
ncbi:nuclear transport factor 2 family protein [Chitinophaga sp. CC14]|uniref:YybH family protein n=1 Tax=Chitinophaga sp. CC14 TaxID=3029199 RepID=UPI003B820FD7